MSGEAEQIEQARRAYVVALGTTAEAAARRRLEAVIDRVTDAGTAREAGPLALASILAIALKHGDLRLANELLNEHLGHVADVARRLAGLAVPQ
jgi:hypothetical protein